MPNKQHDHSTGAWASTFAPRARGERRYWLVKSEPDVFSFDDLLAAPKRTTQWNGVRNFTARNFMRDGMKKGDRVFFYHSSTKPQAIVGICEVVEEAYPDPTAFDPKHDGFDPKSTKAEPIWFMVDLRAVEPLPRPVTLTEIKARKELAGMGLLRVGRLSVTPVTAKEWEVVCSMASSP
jgi:predicted RNA-binding protein with PUA-like domain